MEYNPYNPGHAHHIPPMSPSERDVFLDPPRRPQFDPSPSFAQSTSSSLPPTPSHSQSFLPLNQNQEQYNNFPREAPASRYNEKSSKKKWLWLIPVLLIVAAAVVVPVYFRPKQNNTSASSTGAPSNSTNAANGNPKTAAAITGGDGSTITTEDGDKFTYTNSFGGYWVSDPNNPFDNSARPNSWTPPLNQSWVWGKDRIHGVNIGGLFVIEPFITPAFFQRYAPATDEWELSLAMAADTAGGGLSQLEEHYKTFITEKDIADIAGAGLNWIRLPIPFWAIETYDGEPFLERVCWKYILRLIGWARKYGLRVNLDLHTIPGSQNGLNHSGKLGSVNFLHGTMGIANAQRALSYIRIITEFFSAPEYKDVVPMFSIMNEALLEQIGRDQLTSFYLEAHKMIREITGVGQGPFIAIGEGFAGVNTWNGFLPNSDRIALDYHPYFAFTGQANTQPISTGTGDDAGGPWPKMACEAWGPAISQARKEFGVTIAGEMSNGFNDCALLLRGTKANPITPNCSFFEDSSLWDDGTKAGLQAFAEASMDALKDFFFWTWKIGNSTKGIVEAPLWSYSLGLERGWMPKDPRTAEGKCARLGSAAPQEDGVYQPWQTGGAGAGNIAPSVTAQFPWPPNVILPASAPPAALPSYTPTGTIITLPPPTFAATPTPSPTLDGWFNDKDTAPIYTPIAGCAYPNSYDAVTAVAPQCGTPPPVRRNARQAQW